MNDHELSGELLRRMGTDAAQWAAEFDVRSAIEGAHSAGYMDAWRHVEVPPADWYRAPNGHGDDVIWARRPGGNHDDVIAARYDVSPELWEWLERVVPEGEPC